MSAVYVLMLAVVGDCTKACSGKFIMTCFGWQLAPSTAAGEMECSSALQSMACRGLHPAAWVGEAGSGKRRKNVQEDEVV